MLIYYADNMKISMTGEKVNYSDKWRIVNTLTVCREKNYIGELKKTE